MLASEGISEAVLWTFQVHRKGVALMRLQIIAHSVATTSEAKPQLPQEVFSFFDILFKESWATENVSVYWLASSDWVV